MQHRSLCFMFFGLLSVSLVYFSWILLKELSWLWKLYSLPCEEHPFCGQVVCPLPAHGDDGSGQSICDVLSCTCPTAKQLPPTHFSMLSEPVWVLKKNRRVCIGFLDAMICCGTRNSFISRDTNIFRNFRLNLHMGPFRATPSAMFAKPRRYRRRTGWCVVHSVWRVHTQDVARMLVGRHLFTKLPHSVGVHVRGLDLSWPSPAGSGRPITCSLKPVECAT